MIQTWMQRMHERWERHGGEITEDNDGRDTHHKKDEINY